MDDNNAIVNGFEFKFGNYEYTFIIKAVYCGCAPALNKKEQLGKVPPDKKTSWGKRETV